MMIGRLYYDNNSKRSNMEKVKLALKLYKEKVGTPPNIIMVNEQMRDVELEEVSVQVRKYILPFHILIGIEDKK